MLRVHLKVSKCEQFGQGVDVFIGRTEDELCLVVAVLNYIPQKGEQLGPFFHFGDRNTLTKARFTECMTLHQASPTDTKKLTNGGGASS